MTSDPTGRFRLLQLLTAVTSEIEVMSQGEFADVAENSLLSSREIATELVRLAGHRNAILIALAETANRLA